MIYIRVDGNEIIATGHVMRCLSIAVQLQKLGNSVKFLVADDRPCDMIRSAGFQAEVLHTVWNDLNQETEVLCRYLREQQASVLLLDSYFVTPEYLQALSEQVKVIYIDDLNRFLYPVHTVINYGNWSYNFHYEEKYADEAMNTRFLLGCQYAPLREEFEYQPYVVKNKVERVLITVGGTDQLNITGALLQQLLKEKELSDIEYHAIIGCFNQHKEQLSDFAKNNRNVHLHENVTNMAGWMRSCDVAISAGGSTLYELCACGTPTICLEIADNQRGSRVWEQEGYMYYAGNAADDIRACVNRCMEHLIEYKNSYEARKRHSEKQQALVDGLGAGKIAEYIDGIMNWGK